MSAATAEPIDSTDAFDLATFSSAYADGEPAADTHPPSVGDGRVEQIDYNEFLKWFAEE